MPQRRRLEVALTTSQANGFDLFWAAYPKKACKKEARYAWSFIRADYALILRAVLAQSVPGGTLDPAQMRFVPYPATWLNAERWEDETIVVPRDCDLDAAALEAWGKVRKALTRHGLRWPDAKAELPPLVVKVVDLLGWTTICRTNRPEVMQAQFVRAYRAMSLAEPQSKEQAPCQAASKTPSTDSASEPKSLPTRQERDQLLQRMRQSIGHMPAGGQVPSAAPGLS